MGMKQAWVAAIGPIPETRLMDLVLAGAAIAFAVFYFVLFVRSNGAPVFLGSAVPGSLQQYQYFMDGCHASSSRISVSGWLAKPGVHRGKHLTTALIRDESDGRMFAMKTDLPIRPDVTEHLNKILGDTVGYNNTGFAASLNVRASGRRIRKGQVYIAYDEGGSYTLLAMPCMFPSSK